MIMEHKFLNKVLFRASARNQLTKIKFLLKLGLDINEKNEYGYTALHYAAMNNCLEVVKFLIENGANINLCNKKGQSPLEIAHIY